MLRRAFLKSSAGILIGGLAARTWPQEETVAAAAACPFPIAVLEGGPRERGRIHGETLRAKIRELGEAWKKGLGRAEGETVEDYLALFVKETRFQDAIRKWTPDLLEEIHGIAEGSGLPFDTVYAMQLVDEEWWWSMNRRLRTGEKKGDKCTVVAGPRQGDDPALVAQNIDIPGYGHGFETVLRIRAAGTDVEQMVVTYAGFIAMNGLNSRGVAVCMNALLPLDNTVEGLPVSCIVRGVLERPDRASAEAFLTAVRHASGQAYTLGDPKGIGGFEGSAKGAARVPADPATGRIVHTNHPLASEDFGIIGRRVQEQEKTESHRGMANSRCRFDSAAKRVLDPATRLTIAAAKAALGAHDAKDQPVCRHFRSPEDGYTAACTIFELGVSPKLHLAANPPCAGRFAVLEF